MAHQLIVCLSTVLGIKPNLVITAMRDHASVNGVAMCTLCIVFPQVLDIGCFVHTLDHVWENFNTPFLDEFIRVWINVFSRSSTTKLAWKSRRCLLAPSYSAARWWSKWEVAKQVHDAFSDVSSFILT